MEDPYKLSKEGQEALDRFELGTAETKFLSALEHMNEDTRLKDRCCVQCLRGLAEINAKRARLRRHHIEEWHTLCLRVIAYYKRAVEYCQKAKKTTCDEINKEWLQGILPKCEQELRQHESAFQVSLKSRLVQETKMSYAAKRPRKVNTQWLVSMENHIKQMLQTYSDGSSDGSSDISSDSAEKNDLEIFKSDESIQVVDNTQRIDFDKVRSSIMTLVKGITTDMRQKHTRRHLPESTLKRTVSLEVISNLTPSASSNDILGLFEDAIVEHRSKEAFPYTIFGGSALDLTQSGTNENADNSKKRKAISEGDDPIEGESEDEDTLKEKADDSDEAEDTFNTAQLSPRRHSYQYSAEFPVWNRNPKRPKTLQLRKRHTDTDIVIRPARSLPQSTFAITNNHNYHNFQHYQVTEYMLEITFAEAVSKLADGLLREGDTENATKLYDHALEIFRATNNMDTKSAAHILTCLGGMKGHTGDISECAIMLENAISIYDNLENDDQKYLKKALVLLKLGEMYMRDKDHNENIVFDYVIEIVKREINKEVQTTDGGDTTPTETKNDPDLDPGDSICAYPTHVQEAMSCFQQALTILSDLRTTRSQLHTSEYISVLTRLGDCHIITGNCNKAVLCYEEALYLLKNTFGSSSLENNAHLLVMLGVSNFILRNYSKAVAVFTTASVLQQHLYPDESSFACAFTFTMIGFCHFMNKLHYRCIACCLRAFDMYNTMYKDKVHTLKLISRWFITQTLYTIGYAFMTIDYHDKALFYLVLCKEMLVRTEEQDCQQLVHVMKIMGDVYLDCDQKELALECFNESMTLSNTLGDQAAPTALKNQLLNCMAGIQVSTKQYDAAAEYLEQALDCQRNLETSIKGDLAGILLQLGQTSLFSGDLEKALECFLECLDAYHEIKGTPGPEIASVLVKIASLYHVKAYLEEDEEKHKEYIFLADRHFKDAVAVDKKSCYCVLYANFLFHNSEYTDALEVILEYIYDNRKRVHQLDLHYTGVEQAILPDHFEHEADGDEEISFDSYVLAAFIAILCFKELGLTRDADDTLVFMCQEVMKTEIPINYAILGYALMELETYEAAAESFEKAFMLKPDYETSRTNHETCLGLCKYADDFKSLSTLFEADTNPFYEHLDPLKTKLREQKEGPAEIIATGMRDSGYYDNAELEILHPRETYQEEMSEVSELSLIQETLESKDIGYTSTEDLKLEAPVESITENSTEWTTYETVIIDKEKTVVDKETVESENVYDTTVESNEWRTESGTIETNEYDSKSVETITTEETWESQEETVTTPPEIIALLKRQQQQQEVESMQGQGTYSEYTTCSESTNVIESSPSSGSTRTGSDRGSPYSTLSTNTVLRYNQETDQSDLSDSTNNFETWTEYSTNTIVRNSKTCDVSKANPLDNLISELHEAESEPVKHPSMYSHHTSNTIEKEDRDDLDNVNVNQTIPQVNSSGNKLDRLISDLRQADKSDIDDTIADLQAIATGSYTTGNINKSNDTVIESNDRYGEAETWVTEESSMETPQAILDILRKQSSNDVVEHNTEISMDISPEEDSTAKEEDVWITEEEVVQETPSEIIAMMQKSTISNSNNRSGYHYLDNSQSRFNDYDHLRNNEFSFHKSPSFHSNRVSPNNNFEGNTIFNTRSYENIASIPAEEVGHIKEVRTEKSSPEVIKLIVGEHAELSDELTAGLESLGIISQLDYSGDTNSKTNLNDRNLEDMSIYSSNSSLSNMASPSESNFKQDPLLRSTIDKCLSMKEKYSIKVETPYLLDDHAHEEETEETWQTWEEEEVVETPPELLRAILASQRN